MKKYNVIIKEIKIKEYETVAESREEAFNNIMEFYMYEENNTDNKQVIEIEITEEKQ